MKCVVLALFCAGFAAAVTTDGIISTINIYGHGYRTISKDHHFRFGGDLIYDPFFSTFSPATSTLHHVHDPFFPNTFRTTGGALLSRFTVRDLFETPVVMLTKSTEKDGHLTHVFAEKGLRSIITDPNFKFVFDYFKSPVEKSGIIYNAKSFYHAGLFDVPIHRMVVPKNFKVGDLAKWMIHGDEIPVLVILDKAEMDKVRVDSLTDIAKLGVFDSTIAPVFEPVTPVFVKSIH